MTVIMMLKRQQTLKRQDTLRSSSSMRIAGGGQNLHGNAIGCMAGIFRLISNYQTRRKFLTFGGGRKQEKPRSSTTKELAVKTNYPLDVGTPAPSTLLLPTSVPQLIIKNTTTPRALVARLMGLDDEVPPPKPMGTDHERMTRLLIALERCDEDLKALKMIVETVPSGSGEERVRIRDVDSKVAMSSPEGVVEDGGCGKKFTARSSPVSVLDPLVRSPPSSSGSPMQANGRPSLRQPQHCRGRRTPKLRQQSAISWAPTSCFLNNVVTTVLPPAVETKRSLVDSQQWNNSSRRPDVSTLESVEVVCRYVMRGHVREVVRVGLVMQECIFGDLVDEIVGELVCGFVTLRYRPPTNHSLPCRSSYKRRLRF